MGRRIMLFVVGVLFTGCAALAYAAQLPQEQEYQRTLRAFMATLTEKDFEHGVATELSVQGPGGDVEAQYRNFIYMLMPQPLVGTKRGVPAVNAPAKLFLLTSIEGADGVMVPPVWPEALTSFVQWDYAGNPYHNNRALKLRAFVTASVNMMMLDAHLEKNPKAGRADWYSYQLVYFGCPFLGFKDVLPAEVQKAYQIGVRRMGQRIMDWGPRGEEPNLDMTAPVGLWYASEIVNDPEFTKKVEDHARMMFTDPRYFHPAGFFVERGGLDISFQGMTDFFACWAALASHWPFAKDAVDRVYRLRAHLCLPEPDGTFLGPSHFNSRLSSDPWGDQWAWGGARDYAASLVTDEAAYLVKLPTTEELTSAGGKRAGAFQGQINENPRTQEGRFITNDEIRSSPWQWRMWQTWNFPASVNPGYEFYPKGAYAHRLQLEEKTGSPFLRSPFQREGTFVRDFDKAFYVAKMPAFSVILHTGPVGTQDPADGLFQFAGPLGLSGGSLSAFWTPSTGSVILGRRGGMHWDKSFDKVEEWRTWPVHAVSGCTADAKFFTSARIARPQVDSDIKDNGATVKVGGVLMGMRAIKDPAAPEKEKAREQMYDEALKGKLEYTRVFRISAGGLHVETTVKGDGADKVAELYEVLPIFIRDGALQKETVTATIEFQAAGKWEAATAEWKKDVTAVRVKRFSGAVQITFDRPRRVKLSPQEWGADQFLSRATCRNVLVDLLDTPSVSYDVAPTAP